MAVKLQGSTAIYLSTFSIVEKNTPGMVTVRA